MPKLKFKSKLSRDNREGPLTWTEDGLVDMHALYLADYEDRNNETVVVKFPFTYNQKAHELLAMHKHAPNLYACVDVVGGRKMVVMERLESCERLSNQEANSVPRSVFEDLNDALRVLHQADIVFGDLRNTNVMIVKDREGQSRARIIDFDWAGGEGESRYQEVNPVLTEVGELSAEVRPLTLMSKKHDFFALKYLIKKYFVVMDDDTSVDVDRLIRELGLLSLSPATEEV